MKVDPIKPTLKAPGTKRLKLESDELLSNFAFKFDMRRYDEGGGRRELRDSVKWEPLPDDVTRMYRRSYGEYAPETKRVATYRDSVTAEKVGLSI